MNNIALIVKVSAFFFTRQDKTMITVALIDDHLIVRSGFAQLLGLEPDLQVVAEFGSGREALAGLPGRGVQVCICDISMPDISGLELLSQLPKGMATIMLSVHDSPALVEQALNAGARGFLSKRCSPDELIAAVHTVATGGCYLTPDIAIKLASQAFKEEAVKQFPSGKFALALAGDYYQFYVGSEIMKEEKRVGAVIQFALINPEADGLPAYDSTIGTVVSGYEDEIVREFPKDTEFSYDSDLEDLFQITTEGGILKVTLLPSWSDIRGNYAIYARHNEVYTKIYVKVE